MTSLTFRFLRSLYVQQRWCPVCRSEIPDIDPSASPSHVPPAYSYGHGYGSSPVSAHDPHQEEEDEYDREGHEGHGAGDLDGDMDPADPGEDAHRDSRQGPGQGYGVEPLHPRGRSYEVSGGWRGWGSDPEKLPSQSRQRQSADDIAPDEDEDWR